MVERAPIPQPLDADPEDVFWALSTATTLYSRGERFEALKWLRRAAQSASDLGTDTRALELMKAAADLTATLGAPPPSIAPPPRPSTPPPLPRRAPPPPPSRPVAGPPPLPPLAAPPVAPAPLPPPRAPSPSKLPRTMTRERSGTITGRRGPSKRGSSADLTKLARAALGPGLADAEIDDLEEVTSVIDGKPLAPSAPPVVKAPPIRKVAVDDASARAPAPVKPSVTMKAPGSVPPKPVTGKPPSIPAPPVTGKPASIPAPAPPPKPAVVAKAGAAVRKGTMQLVDEGFESLLDREPAADASALVPRKPEPAKPASSKAAPAAPPEPPKPEPPKVDAAAPSVPSKPELPKPEPPKPEPPKAASPEPAQGPAPHAPPDAAPAEAPAPASPPPAPGILAQRLAVVPGPGGELRLVRLADGVAPERAIEVLVVPLAASGGDRLARLLG